MLAQENSAMSPSPRSLVPKVMGWVLIVFGIPLAIALVIISFF